VESHLVSVETTVVRIRGQDTELPSARVCGCVVFRTGKLLRVGELFDEELLEARERPELKELLEEVRSGPLALDIFKVGRAYLDVELDLDCPRDYDNLAVANTCNFEDWWTSLPQASRKNVRLAEKRGVLVRPVPFDDALVEGIKSIYDESPVRQNKRFWHYGKSLEQVRLENATYLARSQFVGAYLDDELIGFIKFIRVDKTAVLIQILAKDSERERKPMNALVSGTVALCNEQGLTSLVYGRYRYGAGESSLAEFKRRNGFSEVAYPVYIVPLTRWGKVGVSRGLHKGLREVLPGPVVGGFLKARATVLHGLRRGR
jgi:hypothetical protein